MPRRATARARRSADAFADAESAKRSICSLLFESPGCIADVLSHEVTGVLSIRPHTHADLIQFDVIAGCEGEVVLGDERYAVCRTTLMIAYPGQSHGYTLRPGEPPSEVWLVKVQLPRAFCASPARPLPGLLTGLPPQASLMESVVGFTTCWTKNASNASGLAYLAQAITSWPTQAAGAADSSYEPIPAEGASAVARVRRVAHTIGQRVGEPAGLDALAHAAGLSPRHFSRVFREAFGCTPHHYVAAHRLDAARRLLLTPGVAVAQAADQLGFATPAAFSRWFTRMAGQSPRRFRDDPSTF
jgi:AraC family transcriptional regulator